MTNDRLSKATATLSTAALLENDGGLRSPRRHPPMRAATAEPSHRRFGLSARDSVIVLRRPLHRSLGERSATDRSSHSELTRRRLSGRLTGAVRPELAGRVVPLSRSSPSMRTVQRSRCLRTVGNPVGLQVMMTFDSIHFRFLARKSAKAPLPAGPSYHSCSEVACIWRARRDSNPEPFDP